MTPPHSRVPSLTSQIAPQADAGGSGTPQSTKHLSSPAMQSILDRNSLLELELSLLQADKDREEEVQARRLRKMSFELGRLRSELLRADRRYERLEQEHDRKREPEKTSATNDVQGVKAIKSAGSLARPSRSHLLERNSSNEAGFRPPDESHAVINVANRPTLLEAQTADDWQRSSKVKVGSRSKLAKVQPLSPASSKRFAPARAASRRVRRQAIVERPLARDCRRGSRRQRQLRLKGDTNDSEWEDEMDEDVGSPVAGSSTELSAQRTPVQHETVQLPSPSSDSGSVSSQDTHRQTSPRRWERRSRRHHRRFRQASYQATQDDESGGAILSDRHTLGSELGDQAPGTISRRSTIVSCSSSSWSPAWCVASEDQASACDGLPLPAVPRALLSANAREQGQSSVNAVRAHGMAQDTISLADEDSNAAKDLAERTFSIHSGTLGIGDTSQLDRRDPHSFGNARPCLPTCDCQCHMEQASSAHPPAFCAASPDVTSESSSGSSPAAAAPTPLTSCFPFRHLSRFVSTTLEALGRPAWTGVQCTAVIALVVVGLAVGKQRRRALVTALGGQHT